MTLKMRAKLSSEVANHQRPTSVAKYVAISRKKVRAVGVRSAATFTSASAAVRKTMVPCIATALGAVVRVGGW